MDNNNEMKTKSIPRLLLKFSTPAVIALLVNALYNIVDSIFVGKGVGELGLGGVSVSFPVVTAIIAFVMLIAMGATALISLYLGKGEKEDAEKIMGNAITSLIIISVIITILGIIFVEPIVKFFGATDNVIPYAKDYMRVMFIGTIFLSLSVGVNTFIRAEGNPKAAMATMLIGAITNIILDYLFIYVFKWGIKGAAIATVSSYAISTIWVLFYFLSKKGKLNLKKENLIIDKDLFFKILKLGTPAFFLQLTTSIQQLILNRSLAKYGGDNALAAIGVILNLSTLIIMPAMGIGQGAQPILGYNKGAKEEERVKQTLLYALMFSTIVVFLGYLVVRIWPEQVFGLFTNDNSLLETGVEALLIFFKFVPLVAFHMIMSNYFQAIGKSKESTILGLSRQVFLFLPILLILPIFYGITGVWWAAPIADLLAFLLTIIWLFFELKNYKVDNKHKEFEL